MLQSKKSEKKSLVGLTKENLKYKDRNDKNKQNMLVSVFRNTNSCEHLLAEKYWVYLHANLRPKNESNHIGYDFVIVW